MSASASSSGRSSRVRTVAIVATLVAAGVAARGRDVQTPAQPPAVQPPAAPAVVDSAQTDSAMVDSTMQVDSMAMTDSAMMATQAAPAPAPAAPATWPVDPATGQTLINGKPVVGRVFIMQKVDGLTKYENVAQVVSREALAPQAAVVGTSHAAAPANYTRRMRGIMIQSTLWDMDTKRSAVERRHYRASTPASTLQP